jgi:hypothetical protein
VPVVSVWLMVEEPVPPVVPDWVPVVSVWLMVEEPVPPVVPDWVPVVSVSHVFDQPHPEVPDWVSVWLNVVPEVPDVPV